MCRTIIHTEVITVFTDIYRTMQVPTTNESEQLGQGKVSTILALYTPIGNALAGRGADGQTSTEESVGDIF